jgi:uncharacterized protein (DUF2384 family)
MPPKYPLRTFSAIVAEFCDMFGDAVDDGGAWLDTPLPALGDRTPLDLLRAGQLERIAALLGRANRGEPV